MIALGESALIAAVQLAASVRRERETDGRATTDQEMKKGRWVGPTTLDGSECVHTQEASLSTHVGPHI